MDFWLRGDWCCEREEETEGEGRGGSAPWARVMPIDCPACLILPRSSALLLAHSLSRVPFLSLSCLPLAEQREEAETYFKPGEPKKPHAQPLLLAIPCQPY